MTSVESMGRTGAEAGAPASFVSASFVQQGRRLRRIGEHGQEEA